jgi:hypothetical protein
LISKLYYFPGAPNFSLIILSPGVHKVYGSSGTQLKNMRINKLVVIAPVIQGIRTLDLKNSASAKEDRVGQKAQCR